MSITIKILNLNAIKDKKVYYKAGGKFTAITNPTFDLTVTKHGIQADYATTNGKKLYLDFYVKSEDGRSMVPAPTCETYFTVTKRHSMWKATATMTAPSRSMCRSTRATA